MGKRSTTSSQVRLFDPARGAPAAGSAAEAVRRHPGARRFDQGDWADHAGDRHAHRRRQGFRRQLVDGERRLRACKIAGEQFRAEVVEGETDSEEIFARSFAANFGKQDHDPIEIAEGLSRLSAAGKTHEQIARIAGRSGFLGQQIHQAAEADPDGPNA